MSHKHREVFSNYARLKTTIDTKTLTKQLLITFKSSKILNRISTQTIQIIFQKFIEKNESLKKHSSLLNLKANNKRLL